MGILVILLFSFYFARIFELGVLERKNLLVHQIDA